MFHYKTFFPGTAEKPIPYYKLLKQELLTNVTCEEQELSGAVKKTLSEAWKLARKQLFLAKELVLTSDEIFGSAVYTPMIECSTKPSFSCRKGAQALF